VDKGGREGLLKVLCILAEMSMCNNAMIKSELGGEDRRSNMFG
jgi:hypothetical protein